MDSDTVLLDPDEGRRLAELDRRAETLREILKAHAGRPVDGAGPELARVEKEATEIREAAPGTIATALGWVIVDSRSPFSVFKLRFGQRPPRSQSGNGATDAARECPVIDRATYYRVPLPAPRYSTRPVWHRPAGIATQTLAPREDVERFANFHGLELARLPFSWLDPQQRSAWLLVGPFGADSWRRFAGELDLFA